MIGAYHQLWHIEKSFRMSKHDLRARPIYHHKRESIDAHLTIVFAALAVTRLIEDQTGWSIKKFVRTARRYRTVEIRAGQTDPHRRRPTATRPTRRPRRDHLTPRCALIWPKSGHPGRNSLMARTVIDVVVSRASARSARALRASRSAGSRRRRSGLYRTRAA